MSLLLNLLLKFNFGCLITVKKNKKKITASRRSWTRWLLGCFFFSPPSKNNHWSALRKYWMNINMDANTHTARMPSAWTNTARGYLRIFCVDVFFPPVHVWTESLFLLRRSDWEAVFKHTRMAFHLTVCRGTFRHVALNCIKVSNHWPGYAEPR